MPELTIEYMRLDQIRGADRNPKLHDEAGLAESINEHGFIESVTRDDRTGKLIGGHGRIESLRARMTGGANPPPECRVDGDGMWLVPVQCGWASRDDAQAEAAVIALNRYVEKGGHDRELLARMLGDLNSTRGLSGTGFDGDDLADMLAALAPPSLDDLEGRHGDPDPSALWPVIRHKVPPAVRDRYNRLVAGWEGGEVAVFTRLLDLAERGAALAREAAAS